MGINLKKHLETKSFTEQQLLFRHPVRQINSKFKNMIGLDGHRMINWRSFHQNLQRMGSAIGRTGSRVISGVEVYWVRSIIKGFNGSLSKSCLFMVLEWCWRNWVLGKGLGNDCFFLKLYTVNKISEKYLIIPGKFSFRFL